MKPCSQFQEAMVLDVHGELSPVQREPLADHLARCVPCRAERDRLRSLVARIRETQRPPDPTWADARRLARRVAGAGAPGQRRAEGPFPARRLLRIAPVLAAASLALALFWVTGPGGSPETPPRQDHGIAAADPEEKEILQAYELLRNLDLLKEMDHLQQLVRRVDRPEAHRFQRPGHDQVRRRGGWGTGHA